MRRFIFNSNRVVILSPPPNCSGMSGLHCGHALEIHLQYYLKSIFENHGVKVDWITGYDHAGTSLEILFNPTRKMPSLNVLVSMLRWSRVWKQMVLKQLKEWNIPEYSLSIFSLSSQFRKYTRCVYKGLEERGMIQPHMIKVSHTQAGIIVPENEIKRHSVEKDLWYIRYYAVDSDQFLTIATSRPNTIFWDIALVCHPEDERYQALVGEVFWTPLGRKIKLFTSYKVDRDFGTGILKLSPQVDWKDYDIAKEIAIEFDLKDFRTIDQRWYSSETISPEIDKCIDRKERYVSTEKFFNKTLGQWNCSECIYDGWSRSKCIDVGYFHGITYGKSKPKWAKRLLENWANTSSLWNVERRMNWGVSVDQNIVLDTWFSAAIWPLFIRNVLGVKHPMILYCGWDIMMFWYMRMEFMWQRHNNNLPAFDHVYFHPLIKFKGSKMSKSKGNVVNPNDLIRNFGIECMRVEWLRLGKRDYYVDMNPEDVRNKRIVSKLHSMFNLGGERFGDFENKLGLYFRYKMLTKRVFSWAQQSDFVKIYEGVYDCVMSASIWLSLQNRTVAVREARAFVSAMAKYFYFLFPELFLKIYS